VADWNLLQTPNFAAAALNGYQAGQALGRHKRLDAALGQVDMTRPETFLPVLAADPAVGSAAIDAYSKVWDHQRTAALGSAFSNLIRMHGGVPTSPALGGGLGPSNGAALGGGGLPMPAPGTGSGVPTSDQPPAPQPPAASLPSSDPNAQATPDSAAMPQDIVVTGHRPAATTPAQDYAEGVAQMARYATPEQLSSAVEMLSKLDKAGQDAMTDATGTLAVVGQKAKAVPYEQRQAFIQKFTPMLLQHHLTAEQISAFDPTDDAIDVITGQAQGIDKTISAQQRAAEMTETHRHNVEGENQGRQRVGIEAQNAATAQQNAATSRGQLGVAKGRLALAGKVAAGGGVSGASTADLLAMARGQKGLPAPSASDIFAIAGDQ
jgi:hypothetical protein